MKRIEILFVVLGVISVISCNNKVKDSKKIKSRIGLKSIVLYSNISELCRYYNNNIFISDFICNESNDYVLVFRINEHKYFDSSLLEKMEIKIVDDENSLIFEDIVGAANYISEDGEYSPNTKSDVVKLEKDKKYRIIIDLPKKILSYDVEVYLGIPLSYVS